MKFTTYLLLAALAGALTGAAFHSDAAGSGEVLLSKPSNWVNFRAIDRISEKQTIFADCIPQSKLEF